MERDKGRTVRRGPCGNGGTKYGSGREGEKFRGRRIIIIMEEEETLSPAAPWDRPCTERLSNEGPSLRRKNRRAERGSEPAGVTPSGGTGGARPGGAAGGGAGLPARARRAAACPPAGLSRGQGHPSKCHQRHLRAGGCDFPLTPAGREECFPLLFSFPARCHLKVWEEGGTVLCSLPRLSEPFQNSHNKYSHRI
ncbi:uncharacterized protein LOC129735972 isoform X4 [Falco cherrug]|uniref:uncharacterized protein LOC129735972 isoform X4 n=1 Tax=Falco cherrug TaxID=345164 RepID=UPI002478A284|nr:uncharacterized protein LOC129735972 isoform X4 [Falco cherrug]